jgi:hypothetical protein
LICIYKTDLKKKKNFLFEIGSWAEIQPVGPAWPALPTLRVAHLSQPRPSTPTAAGRSGHRVQTHSTNPLARIRPNKHSSDPLGLKPNPNPSSFPLSRPFKTAFIPFSISPYLM